MINLWTFGDSFTDTYLPPKQPNRHWRHEYFDWKGYEVKTYPKIIAEELNFNLINKGRGGVDNSHIFEEFCKVCDKIVDEDVVIFGWTSQNRFRLNNRHDQWGHFNQDFNNKDSFFAHKSLDTFDHISESTIKELLVNRDGKLYSLEIMNWVKLINHTLKNVNVIHWTWDLKLSKYGIMCSEKYETIRKETNGEINDGHWSENGQKQFANLLINEIKQNKKPGKKLL